MRNDVFYNPMRYLHFKMSPTQSVMTTTNDATQKMRKRFCTVNNKISIKLKREALLNDSTTSACNQSRA